MIEGRVYDVSNFQHPGGKQIQVDNSGRDCTREFLDVCHKTAHEFMPEMFIGNYELKESKVWNPVADDSVEESNTIYYILCVTGIVAALYFLGLL
jgi:cytochrome b involved in lipid metabolism